MFGLQNNDPSRFPSAVRDIITLGNARDADVVSSEARITVQRHDGTELSLQRAIKGGNSELVEVIEGIGPKSRMSRLRARRETMSDESGGLQRFLYEWMGLPRVPLMTSKGQRAEIYLENIAPLFFIDQTEGWTDLQALQVYRYQLQDVSEAAVEYILGARTALKSRLERQEHVSVDARLKGKAEELSARVVELCRAQGWTMTWSSHGKPVDIVKRWSGSPLSEVVRDHFNMDVAAEGRRLNDRITALRASLALTPKGASDLGPASQASQEVVELKTKRHELRVTLREARLQLADHHALLATIEHRSQSSKDVLRLKREGIGRLDLVECPTCHRDLDPATFELSQQSTELVEAHIAALQKQRKLMLSNVASLEAQLVREQHDVAVVEERLAAAERTMAAVNQAGDTTREGLAKTAMDLAAAERELDALRAFSRDLGELERDLKQWTEEVESWTSGEQDTGDLRERVSAFENKLRGQLEALGHSALTKSNRRELRLDERYTPYLGARRLRSLGSASDHPRLVAAYALALAQASQSCKGNHPGIVVLDEPQQQNPDEEHVELILRFLEHAVHEVANQVIVMTSLKQDQVGRLTRAGVRVTELPEEHFLQAVPHAKD